MSGFALEGVPSAESLIFNVSAACGLALIAGNAVTPSRHVCHCRNSTFKRFMINVWNLRSENTHTITSWGSST